MTFSLRPESTSGGGVRYSDRLDLTSGYMAIQEFVRGRREN